MITKNLEKIRKFTQEHPELLKSHHFLFNCPLNKEFDKAEALVIGINPGESDNDWNFQDNLPTEESNEFDFHERMGNGRSSVRWSITLGVNMTIRFGKTKKKREKFNQW